MSTETTTSTTTKRTLIRPEAMQTILAFAGLIVIFLAFYLTTPYFRPFDNLVAILLSTAVNGVLALGVTFVIITGGIDLSIGTILTFSAVMTGVFVVDLGLPVPLGVILGLLSGALCGLINGFVIAKMKVPPFIATLGMMMMTKGLSLILSRSKPIYFTEIPSFRPIAMGNLIPGLNIPNAVWILFAAAIIASLILGKTILGRYNFAIGSNEEATRLSGVNVDAWKMAIYTLCGLFAGLGGVLMASRLDSAQPALGAGYELDAIAAVVIGAVYLDIVRRRAK